MKHLYTNETDTVVAESPEDASKVWSDYTGEECDSEEYPWSLIPDEENDSILFEEEVNPEYIPDGAKVEKIDGVTRITATAGSWAKSRFSYDGFLCSTEY